MLKLSEMLNISCNLQPITYLVTFEFNETNMHLAFCLKEYLSIYFQKILIMYLLRPLE